MTTPPSSPHADLPDAANGVSQPPTKAKRKGPRRATAPAGSPTASVHAATAVLLVDADGALVSSPGSEGPKNSLPSTPDAGRSPTVADARISKEVAASSEGDGHVAQSGPGANISPSHVLVHTPANTVTEPPADPVPETKRSNNNPVAPSVPSDNTNGPAPKSRRERRQTEQKSGSDVELSKPRPVSAITAAVTPVTTLTHPVAEGSDPEKTVLPLKPVKKRSRVTLFIRGLLSFLLISVLVAALGTVLVGENESAVGPAETELNRQAAWERTTALSADAVHLSEVASTPKLAEALRVTVQNLDTQAAALDDGLPASTVEASAIPTELATAIPDATLAGLVSALTRSGEELLHSALTAERAMGRVFAAAGTSQLLQGRQLSAVAGSTPPKSSVLPGRQDFAQPQGPQCSSTLEPRSGVTVDSALRAAAVGEQKAVYAYQVAATRLDEPQFAQAIKLLAGHQEKLDLLNAELTVRCLQAALPVAGYELDSALTGTPIPALAELESELSTIYADVIALSTPAAESDVKSTVSETPGPPTPSGTPTAGGATSPGVSASQPANNGLLREMSVAWLLDSSAAHIYWGGSVGPLAGMNP